MSLFIIKHKHYLFSFQRSLDIICFTFLFSSLAEKRTILSAKKLIKIARKWHKFVATQRKRITLPRNGNDTDSCTTSSFFTVGRGQFIVYTTDQRCFVIPLAYLKNEVILQLLNMSEEEFGLPSGGPITLPCDSAFMDYIISLIKKGAAAEDLHKELLLSVTSCCCSISSLHQEWRNKQLLVY